MAEKRDYYEVLGVEKNATDADIKRAFRRKAKECHPDLHPDDKEAEARFKELNEANEVLSDPDKRARYDQFGFNDPMQGGSPFGGGNPFGGMDFGGMGGMGDVLEQIFGSMGGMGGMGGRARRNGPRRGGDVMAEVRLDFREACLGCRKTVSFQRRKTCGVCNGSGAKPGTQPVTCTTCKGAGQVRQNTGWTTIVQGCPTCNGTGKMIQDKCTGCGGRGQVLSRETREVNIPAGVDEDSILRVPGCGDPGSNGGPDGDLQLRFRISSHPIFKRRGTNLYMDLPVTFTQAAMGAEIDIATLTGAKKIVIREGTQPGEEFRLTGEGVADVQGGRKGDLIYRVVVEIPRKLSDKQRELLQQFDAISSEKDYRTRKGFFDALKNMFTGG